MFWKKNMYNSTASARQNKSERLLKEKLPIFAYHILYFSLNTVGRYLFSASMVGMKEKMVQDPLFFSEGRCI